MVVEYHSSVLVVGNGMVGEERRAAYDRVHLSSVFDGSTADELTLGEPDFYRANGVELLLGDPVVAINTKERFATTANGNYVNYVSCVLATGSAPFVPPIPGTDA